MVMKKDNDTKNDRENGLRMKDEMTIILLGKRFCFITEIQERKAESRSTFQIFANYSAYSKPKLAKECNSTYSQLNISH